MLVTGSSGVIGREFLKDLTSSFDQFARAYADDWQV
jgi:hypothetical protein